MSSYPNVSGIMSSVKGRLLSPKIINPQANKIEKSFIGYVVSDKMQKTVNVEITQYYLHPLIKKYVRTSKRFMTHDELEEAEYGDLVEIKQSRPISKRKHWILHKIIRPKKSVLVSQEMIYKTPLELNEYFDSVISLQLEETKQSTDNNISTNSNISTIQS